MQQRPSFLSMYPHQLAELEARELDRARVNNPRTRYDAHRAICQGCTETGLCATGITLYWELDHATRTGTGAPYAVEEYWGKVTYHWTAREAKITAGATRGRVTRYPS